MFIFYKVYNTRNKKYGNSIIVRERSDSSNEFWELELEKVITTGE